MIIGETKMRITYIHNVYKKMVTNTKSYREFNLQTQWFYYKTLIISRPNCICLHLHYDVSDTGMPLRNSTFTKQTLLKCDLSGEKISLKVLSNSFLS